MSDQPTAIIGLKREIKKVRAIACDLSNENQRHHNHAAAEWPAMMRPDRKQAPVGDRASTGACKR
jgi:hypothetical protein